MTTPTERAAQAERELFEAEWLRLGKEVERAPVEWGNGPNAYMWADTADAWRLWDTAFQAGRASRAQEAPAPMQSDIDAMRKMQAEYDSLAERWREARPYSQEVANLHATFKAFDSRLGKLIEGGLFKRLLAALSASPPLPAAPEQPLPPSLKDTPYGPAILLDDVRDAERWRALGAAATPEMIAAGKQALYEASHGDLVATDEEMQAAWRAMIAAQQQEKP